MQLKYQNGSEGMMELFIQQQSHEGQEDDLHILFMYYFVAVEQ